MISRAEMQSSAGEQENTDRSHKYCWNRMPSSVSVSQESRQMWTRLSVWIEAEPDDAKETAFGTKHKRLEEIDKSRKVCLKANYLNVEFNVKLIWFFCH